MAAASRRPIARKTARKTATRPRKIDVAADATLVFAKDRATWRRWLAKNHETSPRVWLGLYKKESGTPSVTYAEAVEEALCFGWIDSAVRKLSPDSWKQLFSPRKTRSAWSKLNKGRVQRMIAEGKMTAAGLAKIERAKRDGSWNALAAMERLTMPDDLTRALRANRRARANWEAFAPSSRKAILWWIESAKSPVTRARRVTETTRLAALDLRAGHPESRGQ
jgi:uncharacterized protein YdeI (YjbR/CyaY-like superfamily)